MSRDLLKEAIADAKAVKETAIANAKAYLEEAFTPQLRSMLAAKLEEMDEETEEVKEMSDPDMRHGEDEDGEPETGALKQTEKDREITEEEELDLDEILNSLEEEDASVSEDARTDAEQEGYKDGFDDAKDDVEDALKKMKVSEKKQGYDDREDESIGMRRGKESGKKQSYKDRRDDSYGKFGKRDKEDRDGQKINKESIELEEAYNTIKTLKSELNEINLLNAKLLYTNKIFRNKALTEAQKVKILNAFDKATSVKEVKIVFETLNENIKVKTKSAIKENLGFASKATGTKTGKSAKPVVETDPMVARFKKLAGLS